MPEQIRTFVAIPLPPEIIRMADRVQQKFRDAGVHLKWVRPENIHLTLQFLGDIAAERVPEIKTAIESAAAGIPPMALHARNVGVFPNMKQPRVLWLGVAGEVQTLIRLQRQIGENMARIGFPPENRPFRGHLTLGRLKDRRPVDRLRELIPALADLQSEPFTADRVSLFKSDLKPTGAVYTRLAEIPCTGSAAE